MKVQLWSKFISVIWIGSICIVSFYSLIPRVEFPIDFWQADKVYHFIAYSWLAILPMIGYKKRRFAAAASFSMILLGISLEIGQLYVPGRLFSLADIAMNTAGVILGFFCGDYSRHNAETLRNIFTSP
jgi:glycopeptide antibiotics resistance protein